MNDPTLKLLQAVYQIPKPSQRTLKAIGWTVEQYTARAAALKLKALQEKPCSNGPQSRSRQS